MIESPRRPPAIDRLFPTLLALLALACPASCGWSAEGGEDGAQVTACGCCGHGESDPGDAPVGGDDCRGCFCDGAPAEIDRVELPIASALHFVMERNLAGAATGAVAAEEVRTDGSSPGRRRTRLAARCCWLL